ncbi:MAG: hypothetical protein SFW67_28615 [Myxococcaceae bacterium]|nr:hypothetical protein [Myxococcaceae bacterium]
MAPPRKMTEAEARAAGFEEVVDQPRRLTEADARAQGFEEVTEATEGAAPSSDPSAAGVFGVNALDSLSVVGVPAVLAAVDEVKYGDSNAKGLGVLDRYRKRRDIYRKAKSDADATSPAATLGGQLAPALIPAPKGATLAQGAKRGAAVGALHGLLGGSADTAGGDLEDTVTDVVAGAAGGAGGELLGAAAGRFTRYLGEKAGSRLDRAILERVRSILGKYGQRNKDAVAAVKNLKIQDAVEQLPSSGQPGAAGKALAKIGQEFPQAEADLMAASAKNARKQVRQFDRRQQAFGPTATPDEQLIRSNVEKNISNRASELVKSTAAMGARGALGAAAGAGIAAATGNESSQGAALGAAIGGASKLYAARKLAKSVMEHPMMLQIMAKKLPALGNRMASTGGNMGMVAGYLTALLATDDGQRAFEEAQAEAESARVEPIGWFSDEKPDAGVPAESDVEGSMVQLEPDGYRKDGSPKFKKGATKKGKMLEQPRSRGGVL